MSYLQLSMWAGIIGSDFVITLHHSPVSYTHLTTAFGTFVEYTFWHNLELIRLVLFDVFSKRLFMISFFLFVGREKDCLGISNVVVMVSW